MTRTASIVDGAFLGVCPPGEAVKWLREKRAGSDQNRLIRPDLSYEEGILVARNDPYINFGIARYGTSKAAHTLFQKGDVGIRCTFLAHYPEGGFNFITQSFELDKTLPTDVRELSALMTNPSLSDGTLIDFFERKRVFANINNEDFQSMVIAAGDNERLQKPYERTELDGWSEFQYHKVFESAWNLAASVPATPQWAQVLYHLLYRTQLPTSFDARPLLDRWTFETEATDGKDSGFYLRRRLADTFKADNALLQSSDGALRESFYSRFKPREHPKWKKYYESEPEDFLNAAMLNKNIWQSAEERRVLSELCWAHPDPNHYLDMPNMFISQNERMQKEHPEWFVDEQ